MTKEEIRAITQTLIDAHNAKLKVSQTVRESDQKTYIDARLNSAIENCLLMLNANLSDEQKISYTDRKLTELAIMEGYLKGEDVEAKSTTPITLGLLKTLINDGIEVWESSSDPFLILHYDEVERDFLKRR
jgi:hypothetical protein